MIFPNIHRNIYRKALKCFSSGLIPGAFIILFNLIFNGLNGPAFFYGLTMALKLCLIFMFFGVIGYFIDWDKVIVRCSKFAPGSVMTVILTVLSFMSLRGDFDRIKETIRLRGVNFQNKKFIKRTLELIPVFKVLVRMSLFNSFVFSEVLNVKAFGFSSKKHKVLEKKDCQCQFEIKKLSYKYPHAKGISLRDVDLKINRGEFILVSGISGSGKSTFVRLLSGTLKSFYGGSISGECLFEGTDMLKIDPLNLRSRIGVVFQSPEKQILMNEIEKEIFFGSDNLGIDREVATQRIKSVLDMIRITKGQTATLSGGQKQLVALASVMAMGVDVLVLDEPVSMLDAEAEAEFLKILKVLNKEHGITVVLIEHKIDNCVDYADQVLCFESGVLKDYQHRNTDELVMPDNIKLVMSQKFSGFGGYLPQNVDQYLFNDTAREELEFNVRASGKGCYDKIEEILEKLDMLWAVDVETKFLSAGQRQRVAIAAVLIAEPDEVFLVQPFRALDYDNQLRVLKLLSEYADYGCRVVLAGS